MKRSPLGDLFCFPSEINNLMRKYIIPFKKFLFEQELGDTPAPDPAAVAPVKVKPYTFVFMNDAKRDKLKKKRYPDGSSEVQFPSYSVTPDEMEEWAKKNVVSLGANVIQDSELEVRQKNLIDIVSGKKANISKEDIPFIEKLKNAVATDIFGRRDPDISVIFAADGAPTTEDVDVTFIKYTK